MCFEIDRATQFKKLFITRQAIEFDLLDDFLYIDGLSVSLLPEIELVCEPKVCLAQITAKIANYAIFVDLLLETLSKVTTAASTHNVFLEYPT